MDTQVKYFLRPGDTATCQADISLTDYYAFVPYDMLDIRVPLMNYGEGYKVEWHKTKECTIRPYIIADRGELLEYARTIVSRHEQASGSGVDYSDLGGSPVTCAACGEVFPKYWLKNEPLCAFCNNPHGVKDEASKTDQ